MKLSNVLIKVSIPNLYIHRERKKKNKTLKILRASVGNNQLGNEEVLGSPAPVSIHI